MERRWLAAVSIAGLALAYWIVVALHPRPLDRVIVEQITELNGAVVDRPAPAFELVDLEGNPHTLASLRGNIVFLNFWATWCPPCIEEMPSMLALAQRFDGRAFRMVAVSQDEDPEALVSFLTATGFVGSQVLILQDPNGELSRALGTELLPETYVIDREGTILARFMGARSWTDDASLRLFERLVQRSAREG